MVACWLTRGQTHTIDHAMIDFALSAVQTSIEAHPPPMKVPKNSIGPSRPRSSQACRTSSEVFAGRNKLKYLLNFLHILRIYSIHAALHSYLIHILTDLPIYLHMLVYSHYCDY